MRIQRITMMMVFASALMMGCATTGARQDTDTMPVPGPQDDGDQNFVQPPDGEEEQVPEVPVSVSVSSIQLDGWDTRQDEGMIVYTHTQSGSEIRFTFIPAEDGTPQEMIEDLWVQRVEASLGNEAMDVNMPMSMEAEGRDMSMFTTVEEFDDGLRVTAVFLCFESNLPALNVFMVGVWPEILDAEMMQALERISRGITFSVGETESPPPLPSPPPPPPQLDTD